MRSSYNKLSQCLKDAKPSPKTIAKHMLATLAGTAVGFGAEALYGYLAEELNQVDDFENAFTENPALLTGLAVAFGVTVDALLFLLVPKLVKAIQKCRRGKGVDDVALNESLLPPGQGGSSINSGEGNFHPAHLDLENPVQTASIDSAPAASSAPAVSASSAPAVSASSAPAVSASSAPAASAAPAGENGTTNAQKIDGGQQEEALPTSSSRLGRKSSGSN